MTSQAPAFYDHASNHASAAKATAVAKARESAIEDGTAYKVVATPPSGKSFWWDGCYYDALGLAKDLLFNKYAVTLTGPDGKPVDIVSAVY